MHEEDSSLSISCFLFLSFFLNRLTAFALKTFVQARTFTEQVDQNMIRSGFDWLLRMNTDRGLFDRFGIYNHRHMVGNDPF